MIDFAATISEAYATDGAVIDLGRGVQDGKLVYLISRAIAGSRRW